METIILIIGIVFIGYLIFVLIAFPAVVISDSRRWAKADKKNDLANKRNTIFMCITIIMEEWLKFYRENEHLSEKQIQSHPRFIWLENEGKRLDKKLEELKINKI